MHGNKAKLKLPSLALLQCKSNIQIFELGLIAVHIECTWNLENFRLGLIAVQNDFQIFRAWPYCGANHLFKFSSLALLRCKMISQIFELGLIAVQIGLALLPCTSVKLWNYSPHETTISWVYPRMPLSFPSEAFLIAALISSIEAGLPSLQVKSTTETLGVGTRKAIPWKNFKFLNKFKMGHYHELTGKFSIEFGNNFSDSFCGSSRGGNDILGSATSVSPGFARGTIDSFLSSCVGMDSGHKTLFESEFVVDNFSERCQAVGRAGRVRDNLHRVIVFFFVDTDNEHRGVSRRGGNNNSFGATYKIYC